MKFHLKLRKIIRDGEKLRAERGKLSELVFQRQLKILEKRVGRIAGMEKPQ